MGRMEFIPDREDGDKEIPRYRHLRKEWGFSKSRTDLSDVARPFRIYRGFRNSEIPTSPRRRPQGNSPIPASPRSLGICQIPPCRGRRCPPLPNPPGNADIPKLWNSRVSEFPGCAVLYRSCRISPILRNPPTCFQTSPVLAESPINSEAPKFWDF